MVKNCFYLDFTLTQTEINYDMAKHLSVKLSSNPVHSSERKALFESDKSYISVCEHNVSTVHQYFEIFSCYGQNSNQNKYEHEMMLYTNTLLH